MPRLALTRRTSRGASRARTWAARASRSSVWNGARQAGLARALGQRGRARPEGPEPVQPGPARRLADLAVERRLARAELEHVAEHRQRPAALGAGHGLEGGQGRRHGERVGVVAVVHQQGAAGEPLQPEPPPHRPDLGQAAHDLAVGAAERHRGAGGRRGVGGVVDADQRQGHLELALAHAQHEAQARGVLAQHLQHHHVAALRAGHGEGEDAAPRGEGPAEHARVVGVGDRHAP